MSNLLETSYKKAVQTLNYLAEKRTEKSTK